MRGEHRIESAWMGARAGSSPHARGARGGEETVCACSGIIPACAGSTCEVGGNGIGVRDHPRMRGEHCRLLRLAAHRRGSSPHARGALLEMTPRSFEDGIIPACAGSTSADSAIITHSWDHPRMRGEHRHMDMTRFWWQGSSPHARGAHELDLGRAGVAGIIPACAGSTRHTACALLA